MYLISIMPRRRWAVPTSIQQNRLLHYVRLAGYHYAVNNFPVRVGLRKKRYVDVAIPELMVGFEYDGRQHFTPSGRKKDRVRDEELRGAGWYIIHVNKFNWNAVLANIKDLAEKKVKLSG